VRYATLGFAISPLQGENVKKCGVVLHPETHFHGFSLKKRNFNSMK
jgi:hypothetical protein